jgi:hypothetical protein
VHEPYVQGDAQRADRAWDWRITIPALAFAIGAARRPRMFQVCLAATDHPLAMVVLLENERWIADPAMPAVYVWYLTGAPAIATSGHGQPRLLTSAALDIAVTVSLNSRALGRLWLHAAPEGGTRLLDWYRNRGLEPVPASATLPQPRVGRRRNDSRYFQMKPEAAVAFSMDLDAFR